MDLNTGGTIIWRANAIVIANENRVEEAMRHELAHLFAFRRSASTPPLLSEGLAVWLQETDFGQPIHFAALPLLLLGTLPLPKLLRAKFFFDETHRQSCYILAGSFTGFLIHRYGWDR